MSHFKAPKTLSKPVAEKRTHTQTHHGITTTDDYFWLRAENWQEAMRVPEKLPDDIKQYLKAENAYFKEAMAPTESLQKELIAEMRGRIQEDESDVPDKWGDYAYNTRYEEGSEHPLMVRTPRNATDNSDEEVLLDANIEAKDKDYFELGTTEISPDHKHLAWTYDDNGSEYFTLAIRNLEDGQDFSYTINDIGDVSWCDNQTIFYSRVDESHRPSKVYRHTLGEDTANDVLVMEEKDSRFFMSVDRLLTGEFLIISIGMNDQDEHWFIPTSKPESKPRVIQAREEGLEYSVEQQGDQFIIVTNSDDAVDFKIVSAPVSAPEKANWKEIVPHKSGRMILSLEAYQDWLIWMERENALPSIQIRDNEGNQKQVSFNEEAYALSVTPSLEYQTDKLRFSYLSPTTPAHIYDYDLQSSERVLCKKEEIPSGHDASDYITQRLTATSHDGAQVPITVLYHKSTPLDGSAPCFLYGYGSYGASMSAAFSSNRLSLVDRGFVYVIAHVRGGEEKGRAWYESAKLEGKPNTFHDFIAVAEYLIDSSYTSTGNIVCNGGSAGGLLVGAVANMRPDLFAGVIGDVPFVDVLNTILDDTLPLTPGEWSQWGNPIESEQAYQWIAAYSPYDQVVAKNYPAMLVTAGVSDPRVTYWEPAKWVAKLRELKTDDNVVLLKTNMTSGHFGTTGRFAALEDSAQTYAFSLKAVGLS